MASGILPLNQFILNYDRKLQINDDVLEKAKPEVEGHHLILQTSCTDSLRFFTSFNLSPNICYATHYIF